MIKNHFQKGFTLIEMIVSLALFSVVITMSVGALLILIATNQQLQVEQTIMTNLSFALDSMTREIRTGTDYYCVHWGGVFDGSEGTDVFRYRASANHEVILGNLTRDCPDGSPDGVPYRGVSFKEAGNSITGSASRILYFYSRPGGDAGSQLATIMRRVGNGEPQSIISSGLAITDAEFYVTGTQKVTDGDTEQPTVTIFIEAKEKNNYSTDKTYKVQTTVTQRTLDI